MRNHRSSWLDWAVIAAAAAALPAFIQLAPARAQTSNEVVASVDGEPITERDVEQFAASHGSPISTDDFADSPEARAALKALIDDQLLQQERKRYEDKIDESQVDKYIEQIRTEQHLTDAQFRAALQSQGVSYEDFRKKARDQLINTQMVQSEVLEKIEISDADIKAFYDAHKDDLTIKQERLRLAQILIAVPQNATPQQVAAAQQKAEGIRIQAVKGIDFNSLAEKYSDDDSKSRGGELGWFEPNDINDQILAGVRNLKPGDISPVIRTKYGFHIVKLEDHDVPGPRPLADVKEQIRHELQDERANEQIKKWAETELIKKHYVETLYPKLY
jgi:peptidyl-prolyl cis-trans isomerase SurA